MSDFDIFMEELKNLCKKHSMCITTSSYDTLQVWRQIYEDKEDWDEYYNDMTEWDK